MRKVVLEVQDTGIGDARGLDEGHGFGHAPIHERLAALCRDRATMELSLSPGGAHTRITLPGAPATSTPRWASCVTCCRRRAGRRSRKTR